MQNNYQPIVYWLIYSDIEKIWHYQLLTENKKKWKEMHYTNSTVTDIDCHDDNIKLKYSNIMIIVFKYKLKFQMLFHTTYHWYTQWAVKLVIISKC